MSIGELGRPTLVIALKPSVASRTLSPTPASTAFTGSVALASLDVMPTMSVDETTFQFASTALTVTLNAVPAVCAVEIQRLNQQELEAFMAGMLLGGNQFSDDARDQHGLTLPLNSSAMPCGAPAQALLPRPELRPAPVTAV